MSKILSIITISALAVSACGNHESTGQAGATRVPAGDVITLDARPFRATFDAAGTAQPISEATLSTKLMGSVEAVYVHEGDVVAANQPLVRIDARDLTAKASQIEAGIAEAEAIHREAAAQARRIRTLYEQDAAPKAQLDAVETGLARADAAVRAARANARELAAMREYAVIRAPESGTVVRRMVDPGAFAAPGAPLVTVQNARRLRVRVTATPAAARAVRPGMEINATIEGMPTVARVEGIVPAPAGNVYTINAIVDNQSGRFLAGSAATLRLPVEERLAITLPAGALVREGDLTGVYVKAGARFALRWIRTGEEADGRIEVLSGLKAGDQVLVANTVAGAQ